MHSVNSERIEKVEKISSEITSVNLNQRKMKKEQELMDEINLNDRLLKLENNTNFDFTEREFHLLAESANSDVPEIQLRSVKFIEKLFLTDTCSSIDDSISNQIIEVLVHCLNMKDNPSLQVEATFTLVNIAQNTARQMQAVVSAGVVPIFLHLLSSTDQIVCEQAVRALGLIISQRPYLRDQVIDLKIVPKLLLFMNSTVPIKVMRDVSCIVLNLCRNSDPPPAQHVIDELLFAITYLINVKDLKVLSDAVWAIGYITDKIGDEYDEDDEYHVQIIHSVIESDIVCKVIPLLSHEDENVQLAALRVMENVICGVDEQSQFVIDSGALRHFTALLNHNTQKIRQGAISTLANILAKNEVQVQAVLDAGLIPKIIKHLTESEIEVQCEAAWAIAQFTCKGNKQQINWLIDAGVIPSFCALLSSQDVQLIKIVLDGILNMLRAAGSNVDNLVNLINECEGLDKIKLLKSHDKVKIYKIAYKIIERLSS